MPRLALLFDLDGTLVDSQPGIEHSVRHALASLGRPPPSSAAVAACVGIPLREMLGRLAGLDDADRIEAAVATYRRHFAETGQYESRVYDGIPECLAALGDAAALYVATAKLEGSARTILQHYGLAQRFHGIFGAAPDGARSDKGELLAHALRTARLAPERAAMIGDRAQDIEGARRNGILACGVAWGYGGRAELEQAGAQAIFEAPRDLPAYFRRLADQFAAGR